LADHGETPEHIKDVAGRVTPAATRFLFGGYVAVALASVALSWARAPTTLFETAAGIIFLSVLVSLFVGAFSSGTTAASRYLIWTILCIATATVILFISSAFFGIPERGAILVARLLGDLNIAVGHRSGPSVVINAQEAQWPTSVLTPLDSGTTDVYEKVKALSRRPSLTLNQATLNTGPAVVYLDTLTINDSNIVTQGGTLRIEALRLRSTGGSIKSFLTPPGPLQGRPGPSGGRVILVIYQALDGQLNVDLSGGQGGIGEKGRPGANGRDGEPGENSAQGFLTCSHGGGQGRPGEAGAPGGDGGPGQPGGPGGTLVLEATNPDEMAKSISVTSRGGLGGPGGPGGDGGLGGRGGPGGHGGGLCGGGQAGPSGPNGPPGRIGPPGTPGEDGPQLAKVRI
jgi:hypothetical protein